jgi:hypothetical protein
VKNGWRKDYTTETSRNNLKHRGTEDAEEKTAEVPFDDRRIRAMSLD